MICPDQPTYNPKQRDGRGLNPIGLTGSTYFITARVRGGVKQYKGKGGTVQFLVGNALSMNLVSPFRKAIE
ncbi:hypothetical protein [Pasteuria penetrans]|uniref:hypothetical protein n=1 Tax=Pasteuria penetrans TaxID=86005 RepID=UPI000FC315FD|nr:hypothetical protein [Pasteuria penetrans]